MKNFATQKEYTEYLYRKSLKKDSNIAGLILIIFFEVMAAVSFITILIPLFVKALTSDDIFSVLTDTSFLTDTTFIMIISGLASLITFFGVAIIYSIIAKVDFGKTFPLEKLGFKLTFLLCTFGLAVAMVANYVANMMVGVFDMFGIDAYVDIEYVCDGPIDVLLFYVTVAILPALVEEFAFRGVILGKLRKHSDSLAVLVSAVVFGLIHGNFTQIPFAFVVGLVLGYITVKTNSLLPAIIIHFLNNGISVTLSLLQTNTNLSDHAVNLVSVCFTFVIAVLGINSFTILCRKHKGFFKLYGANNNIPFKEKVKTVCKSPTMIIFSVLTFSEAILMLAEPYLTEMNLT